MKTSTHSTPVASGGQAFVNKILKKKWQQQQFEMHKKKISQAKPQTDTTMPSSLKFPLLKSKRRQLEEDRLTEVERANRILLEKMTMIMNSEESSIPRPPPTNKSTTLYKSHHNHNNSHTAAQINQTMNQLRKDSLVNEDSGDESSRSIRGGKQNHNLNHSTVIAGSMMLDRLRQQKSHYDQDRFKQDHDKKEQILRMRSEYPEQYDQRDSTRKLSTTRSRAGSLSKAMKFQNKKIRIPNAYNGFPSNLDLDSRKEVVTSGGELVTQPPELMTDDEMEELINEVRTAEKKERDQKQKTDRQMFEKLNQGGPILLSGQDQGQDHKEENSRFINSDLQGSPNRMTPEQKVKNKLHQTVSHFHSRQHSNDAKILMDQIDQDTSRTNLRYGLNNQQISSNFASPRVLNNLKPFKYLKQLSNPIDLSINQTSQIKPLNIKFRNDIDQERIVLYREDCREIHPITFNIRKAHKPRFYIIEISRSRYKLYVIAVRIPDEYLEYVMQGKYIYHLAASPKSKVFYTDMTEKQGKKLLQECENNFKSVLDRLFIQFGKLFVRDFDNLMKFGVNQMQTLYSQPQQPVNAVFSQLGGKPNKINISQNNYHHQGMRSPKTTNLNQDLSQEMNKSLNLDYKSIEAFQNNNLYSQRLPPQQDSLASQNKLTNRFPKMKNAQLQEQQQKTMRKQGSGAFRYYSNNGYQVNQSQSSIPRKSIDYQQNETFQEIKNENLITSLTSGQNSQIQQSQRLSNRDKFIDLKQRFPVIKNKSSQMDTSSSSYKQVNLKSIPGNWELIKSPTSQEMPQFFQKKQDITNSLNPNETNDSFFGNNLDKSQLPSRDQPLNHERIIQYQNQQSPSRNQGNELNQKLSTGKQISQFIDSFIEKGSVRKSIQGREFQNEEL
eukprot:403334801